MNKPDWKDAPKWADRLMKSSGVVFYWCNRDKYKPVINSYNSEPSVFGASRDSYIIDHFKLVETRPDPWAEGEERIENIVRNSGEGEHYDELPELDDFLGTEADAVDRTGKPDLIEHNNNNKYSRKIKTIVIDGIDHVIYVDVYDVLTAFNTINPAMDHAIKKMLAPGKRGNKSTIQDMNEAIQSIKRAIELEQEK
jgi:hypothetical protein